MNTYRALLDRELAGIVAEARAAQTADQALAALRRVTDLHEALQHARQVVADTAPPLVRQALAEGVDPATLAGQPYTPTVVRRLAREVGLPPQKPGPRRRQVVDAA